jgi:molybdopterin-containing oxidoreductase family molybdopterin binding subunit
MVSRISDVPAETIVRIATEYAHAAQIGSTIVIQGHQLPLRPVASVTFRGGEGHENAFHTCMAVDLINHLLGAADVPGGAVGFPNTCMGYPGTGKLRFGVEKGVDGMLSIGRWFTADTPWPVRNPKVPTDAGIQELFTMCSFSPIWIVDNQEEIWQKIGLPYRIELMLNFGCNSAMAAANPEQAAEFLKKIPFIVSWDLFANEFAEGFADILLPDTSYLETLTWMDGQGFFFNYPYGMDPWCYHITQPVVKPPEDRRYIIDVWFELLDRIGKRAELNEYWNRYLALDDTEKFKPGQKITWEEVTDKALQHYFGPDHGLEWFKEHGGMIWPKKAEEAYWRCFTDARVPIYLEFMIDMKEKIKRIADQVDIKVNWEQYTPFISWFPCKPHLVKDPNYEFYCFSYRDILHTGSATMEQPWLDEASQMNPYTYHIVMNADAGTAKSLKNGDIVEIEASTGGKACGPVRLMKGLHPRTIGIAATAGHWAKGQPVAYGKGINFNFLMSVKFEECDPITFNIETCVKVKVKKMERA